jgi:hypothetical protein
VAAVVGQPLRRLDHDGGRLDLRQPLQRPAHRQYLAGIAGGGVTGGRLNDGLWLFSLNGTIESLPPGSGDPPPDDGDGNTETNDRRAFLTQFDFSRTPMPRVARIEHATADQRNPRCVEVNWRARPAYNAAGTLGRPTDENA